MGVPARDRVAPAGDPERKPDPRARGWEDVRQALIASAQACALAVAELAADPGSGPALAMAGLTRDVLERLGEIGSRWVLDDAVLEAERQRAWDEGYAHAAARCRLGVIDGGRAG